MSARLATEAATRHPGENFSIGKTSTVAGPPSASPHGDGAPCGKTVVADSVAVTTVATRLNGMAMEGARTWLIGKPDNHRRALFECAAEAQDAGVGAAVSGRSVAGIDAAAQVVIERAGFGEHVLHRGGHGIGIVMHDFPENVPFNPRPLLAGEVYAVEPGLYVPGTGGFRFADVVVVGDAPELLTRAPKDIASQTIA